MMTMSKARHILNLVVAAMALILLMAIAVMPDSLGFIHALAKGFLGWVGWLLAVATLAINILLVRKDFQCGAGSAGALEVPSENGTNFISLKAVEAQLLDVLRGARDVSEPKVHIVMRGEGVPILCQISFKLHRSVDVTGRTEELKTQVREMFLRLIPKGVGIEMNANVLDLVPENAQGESSEFSGPVYPVGADASTES